jgi:single-strand DNA-binding protein
MANETNVTVTGYVAQEPVLRLTGSGTKVVNFRVATTERRYDKGVNGWRDGDTLFFAVSCWRNLGENVLESVHKGDPVVVQGRLRDGSWEKDGVTHAKVEIEATAVGHDLAKGVSRFTKSTLQPRERLADPDARPDAGPDAGTGDALSRAVGGAEGVGGVGGAVGVGDDEPELSHSAA